MNYSKGKSYNEYTKACVHCKTSGYRWGKHKEGWRLFNKDGEIHECFKKESKSKFFTADDIYGNTSHYTFDGPASSKQTTLAKGNWKYIHSSNYDDDFFIVEYKNVEIGRILFNDKRYQFYLRSLQPLTELHLISLNRFCECLNEILGLL